MQINKQNQQPQQEGYRYSPGPHFVFIINIQTLVVDILIRLMSCKGKEWNSSHLILNLLIWYIASHVIIILNRIWIIPLLQCLPTTLVIQIVTDNKFKRNLKIDRFHLEVELSMQTHHPCYQANNLSIRPLMRLFKHLQDWSSLKELLVLEEEWVEWIHQYKLQVGE